MLRFPSMLAPSQLGLLPLTQRVPTAYRLAASLTYPESSHYSTNPNGQMLEDHVSFPFIFVVFVHQPFITPCRY